MVNKEKILNILKVNSTGISGEILSKQLGISRTAIWKNINNLKKDGYLIESSSTGYLLKPQHDLLLPYEFHNESNLYIYKQSTTSTMNIAYDLIEKDSIENGSIVVTENQLAGIGKDGKLYNSPEGGLYFTIIIKPNSPVHYANLYPMAALIACLKVLKANLDTNLKAIWPLELWSEDHKIVGILHEYLTRVNKIKWMTIGIGITPTTSFKRKETLEEIKKEFLSLLDNIKSIPDIYREILNIKGLTANFQVENRKYRGVIQNIDDLGTVTIKSGDTLKKVYLGNSSMEVI